MSMLRKKEGFQGQRAIVMPRTVLSSQCVGHPVTAGMFITDIGYYPKAKFHYRERQHGAEQHILIYCTDGKGWVKIKKNKYELTSGNFIVIPAGTSHVYAAEETNPWTIYWVHFRGHLSAELIRMLKENFSKVDFHDSRIRLFEEIYSTLENGYSTENLCYASLCLYHFLSSFIFPANYNVVDNKEKKDTSNRSIQFMQENLDKMLSLEEIAKSIHLSASHYSAIFRKKTGFSPIEYFNQLKAQKACQYLLFTDLQVKEIAYQLGFEDQYYFTKMFHKLMGVTPNEYRTKRAPK
ncbi:MAG: AraC family transcriptional regulator [Bacteroidia bacterium]|nr:AraC family transcriptional regulator [Bacteroidia bacterium]